MKTTFLSLGLCLAFIFSAQAQSEEVQDLIREGIKLHDKKLYPAAIARYKEAIKLDKNSALAYYELAYTYTAMGERKKAIKMADKVLKIEGGPDDQAYMLKANLLDDLGKTSKALSTYQTALRAYPEDFLMHFNYGVSLFRANRLAEAELALLKGAQLNPAHPSGHYLLGLMKAENDQPAQAVMALYYFLLVEPEGKRAENAHQILMACINGNATEGEDGSFNIMINSGSLNGVFAPANSLISLFGISIDKLDEETEIKLSESERIATKFKTIFGTLTELKAENPTPAEQIWLDLYVDFYRQLLEEESHLETASNLVQLQSEDETIAEWLLAHQLEVKRLQTFVGQ
ncbi:MAG: tetratricopeptide repeat protein [Bacteroidota bacterium]